MRAVAPAPSVLDGRRSAKLGNGSLGRIAASIP